MNLPAVWLGKITLLALRLLGRRGNALPGLVVEKLLPGYLPHAVARLTAGVVVVSGTNGKTTTTKMLASILSQRYRVLTNDTGSNFVRGVITTAVEHSTWTGRLPFDVAVFELDEAWAVRYAAAAPPQRTLLLNVMRDQLDRFGEIDTTAKLLARVAAATTDAVVLNRDDPRVAALADQTHAPVSYFGVSAQLRPSFPNDEELYGGQLFTSHQGAAAELLDLPNPPHTPTRLRIGQLEAEIDLRAAGPHNAQNAAAAAAMALTFGLDPEQIVAGLAAVEPAFGRGQSFVVDGRRLVLHLVKNPAGFRQSLTTLPPGRPAAGPNPGLDGGPPDSLDVAPASVPERPLAAVPASVLVAINDDYADGRDVSWLWDVDFAALATPAHVATAGTRAADMALRLRYQDIAVDSIEPDLEKAVRLALEAIEPDQQLIVFSTYTAMWALHAILLRIGRPA